MDEEGIERLDLRPLQPILKAIAAISNRRELATFLGGTLRADVDVLNSTRLYTDGFTGEQRFFLSYAQNWREKYREPALRREVLTDGHAPDEYRVSTVRNMDGWYAAFDVRAGQPLYLAPTDRVRVW